MRGAPSDDIVVVTGAAGGIGSAVCRAVTAIGARVVGVDRTEGQLVDVTADLTDPAAVEKIVRPAVEATAGNLRGLVNAAGMGFREPFLETTDESWARVLDANLMSTVRMCRIVIPILLRNSGNRSIVNFGSQAGKTGGVVIGAHYSAAKAAVMCLTKTLAATYGPDGIRVNAVAPGIVDTAFLDNVPSMKDRGPSLPLRRLGTPEEIADVVVFLLGEGARYITGETVNVNGGLLMD